MPDGLDMIDTRDAADGTIIPFPSGGEGDRDSASDPDPLDEANAEIERMHRELDDVTHTLTDVSGKADTYKAERDRANELVRSLMTRVAAQSELLSRERLRRGDGARRVEELEAALAPFAGVLASGWDSGELPADAIYPVRMGDLRQAARALAGIATGSATADRVSS